MSINSCLNEKIDILTIDNSLLFKLKENGVDFIKDLWILNKKDLKKMNLLDEEINKIIIKMQLMGIDLNKKVYSKD